MDNTVKVKAQVALEFIAAFICTILVLIGTVQLFVWFGSSIVNRQKKYELTRAAAGNGATTNSPEIKDKFYPPEPLNILFKK